MAARSRVCGLGFRAQALEGQGLAWNGACFLLAFMRTRSRIQGFKGSVSGLHEGVRGS